MVGCKGLLKQLWLYQLIICLTLLLCYTNSGNVAEMEQDAGDEEEEMEEEEETEGARVGAAGAARDLHWAMFTQSVSEAALGLSATRIAAINLRQPKRD